MNAKKIIDGFTHENDHTLKGYFSKALDLVKYVRFQSKTEWCEHKPKTSQVIREVNKTAPTRVIAKVLTSNIGVKRQRQGKVERSDESRKMYRRRGR